MSNETKYSVVGRVEIGTDEYRDLIESVKDTEKRASENYSQYRKEYEKVQSLDKTVKTLYEKLSRQEEFLKVNNLEQQYKIWFVTKNEQLELEKEKNEDY